MNKHIASKLFFKSIILLICSYQLDINKNFNSYLLKEDINKYLNLNQINKNIINYVNNNYDLTGKFYYLRNNKDSECMILINKDNLYVIFIGTQINSDLQSSIQDIITDLYLGLETIPKFDKKIKIHNTYKNNMNCDNLMDIITKICKKFINKNIIICGHSMGCGLATYASIILSKVYSNIKIDLVLISSPKLGNSYLSRYIRDNKNINLYNMVNENEIVPLFPFTFLNSSYKFIDNTAFRFDKKGKCKRIKCNKFNIFFMHSISDHSTKSITENLYKYILYKKKIVVS